MEKKTQENKQNETNYNHLLAELNKETNLFISDNAFNHSVENRTTWVELKIKKMNSKSKSLNHYVYYYNIHACLQRIMSCLKHTNGYFNRVNIPLSGN